MINNDYLDAFVHGYVVRQQMDERQAGAEQRRMIKEYRAAHPEQGWKSRAARVLRRTADRLSPEPAARPPFQVISR